MIVIQPLHISRRVPCTLRKQDAHVPKKLSKYIEIEKGKIPGDLAFSISDRMITGQAARNQRSWQNLPTILHKHHQPERSRLQLEQQRIVIQQQRLRLY